MSYKITPLPYHRSLAVKLVVAMLFLVVAATVLLSLYASSRLWQAVSAEAEEKALAISHGLISTLKAPQHSDIAARAYIDSVRDLSGVAYIYAHDARGQTLLATDLPGFGSHRLGCPDPTHGGAQRGTITRAQVMADLPGRHIAVTDVATYTPQGTVHVAVSRDQVAARVRALRHGMMWFSFAMCLLGLLVAIWSVYALVLRPLRNLTQVVEGIVEHGDLTSDIKVRQRDEVGHLLQRCQRLLLRLRQLPHRLHDSMHSLGEIRAQLSEAVPMSAQRIVAQVYHAETSLSGITNTMSGLTQHVGQLHQSTGEVAKLVEAVSSTNKDLTQSVAAMSDSVERATAAIDEMGRSVQGVADSIQEVHQSTAWVSQFIREMDRALQKVQQNSSAATEISTLLSRDAETCLLAMQKTISGIEQIRLSSGLAAEVIRSLGSRITQIGEMVGLIEGIAHQTNFLALNATIIAAQAGDQGLGFAVIAGEIKGLAERVGVSTREIAELMGHIERESHNAVRAVERGLEDVEQGAQLGRETEVALRKIVSSATQAGHNVTAIAAATVEQTQGSASMTATIHLIATKMQDVREYAAQQAKQAERVMRSAQEMKQLTTVVQDSTQDQTRRWQEINSSFDNIRNMLDLMYRAQRDQQHGSEQVQAAIRAIHSVSEQQTDMVQKCEQALLLLGQQTETLREEVSHFRV